MLLFLAEFLKARIVPKRIKHRIEPEQCESNWLAEWVRRVCGDTLPWLTSFSLNVIAMKLVPRALGPSLTAEKTLTIGSNFNFFCEKICVENSSYHACTISRSFCAYLFAHSNGHF
ncbi:MAG TPA: hypothetical protein VGG52_02170 [Chthoniobacterales bacterium]